MMANGIALIFFLVLVLPTAASEVILDYKATAQTVVGKPFGIDLPRLTAVSGYFVYETEGTADSRASSERGEYVRPGAFAAKLLGHTITGSAQPTLKTEDIQVTGGSIDTFRFIDGKDAAQPMFLDSVADESIEVSLSITASNRLPDAIIRPTISILRNLQSKKRARNPAHGIRLAAPTHTVASHHRIVSQGGRTVDRFSVESGHDLYHRV